MKSAIFLFLLFFCIQSMSAQDSCSYYFDYNSAVGWTTVDNTANTGANMPPRIQVSGGVVQYSNAPDGSTDIRVYRKLDKPLCERWVAEFDFEVNGVGSNNTSIATFLFMVSENNLNGIEDENNVTSVNDFIGVAVHDGNAVGATDMAVGVYVNDGNVRQWPLCESPFIILNNPYKVRLERLGSDAGRITLFDMGIEPFPEVYNCCFHIAGDVSGLSYLQHSNASSGLPVREMTGTVDNTCIKDCFELDDCCLGKEIEGPSQFCVGTDSLPTTYTFQGSPSAIYNWLLPPGVNFTSSGNSITINDWGTISGDITITLEVICNCDTTIFTKTVSIFPSLRNLTGLLSSGGQNDGGDLTINASSSIPNVTHSWVVYEADVCDPTSDRTILNENNGPVAISPIGRNSTFAYSDPAVDPGTCYIVRYIVSYDNGICPVEYRAKILSTGFSEDYEPVFEMYNPSNDESFTKKASNQSNSAVVDFADVFPNPADNKVQVRLFSGGNADVKIFNSRGVLLQTERVSKQTESIDVSTLPSGIYWFVIRTSNGYEITKEIILN